MRALGFGLGCVAFVLVAVSGCLGHDEPCTSHPTDPVCQDPDGGPRPDAGPDTGGGDAHVGCGGTCTGTMSHCLVSGTSETCVGCVAEGDCTGGLHCDMTSHTCVECTTMAQCTDVGMSRCDTTAHTCGACTADGDCTHLTGTTACNVTGGTCAQCSMTNQTACTSGICLTGAGTCAPMGGATSTCGTCTHDAECHAGQLCVPMMYDDPTTAAVDPVAAGNHCLWRQDAAGTGAPNGACSTIRPYVRGTSMTSVDAVTATMCTFRESTCEAQAAFSSTNCMTLNAAGNALCGQASLNDGLCQMLDAAANRCTVFCLSDDDCPGTTCAPGAVPRACTF